MLKYLQTGIQLLERPNAWKMKIIDYFLDPNFILDFNNLPELLSEDLLKIDNAIIYP
jgi:hypothetical protein